MRDEKDAAAKRDIARDAQEKLAWKRTALADNWERMRKGTMRHIAEMREYLEKGPDGKGDGSESDDDAAALSAYNLNDWKKEWLQGEG